MAKVIAYFRVEVCDCATWAVADIAREHLGVLAVGVDRGVVGPGCRFRSHEPEARRFVIGIVGEELGAYFCCSGMVSAAQ